MENLEQWCARPGNRAALQQLARPVAQQTKNLQGDALDTYLRDASTQELCRLLGRDQIPVMSVNNQSATLIPMTDASDPDTFVDFVDLITLKQYGELDDVTVEKTSDGVHLHTDRLDLPKSVASMLGKDWVGNDLRLRWVLHATSSSLHDQEMVKEWRKLYDDETWQDALPALSDVQAHAWYDWSRNHRPSFDVNEAKAKSVQYKKFEVSESKLNAMSPEDALDMLHQAGLSVQDLQNLTLQMVHDKLQLFENDVRKRKLILAFESFVNEWVAMPVVWTLDRLTDKNIDFVPLINEELRKLSLDQVADAGFADFMYVNFIIPDLPELPFELSSIAPVDSDDDLDFEQHELLSSDSEDESEIENQKADDEVDKNMYVMFTERLIHLQPSEVPERIAFQYENFEMIPVGGDFDYKDYDFNKDFNWWDHYLPDCLRDKYWEGAQKILDEVPPDDTFDVPDTDEARSFIVGYLSTRPEMILYISNPSRKMCHIVMLAAEDDDVRMKILYKHPRAVHAYSSPTQSMYAQGVLYDASYLAKFDDDPDLQLEVIDRHSYHDEISELFMMHDPGWLDRLSDERVQEALIKNNPGFFMMKTDTTQWGEGAVRQYLTSDDDDDPYPFACRPDLQYKFRDHVEKFTNPDPQLFPLATPASSPDTQEFLPPRGSCRMRDAADRRDFWMQDI